MTKQKILELLNQELPLLEKLYNISSLKIFGSVARGESGPNSDLDVLVEFDSGPNFDTFMGLKLHLEDLLHMRVDLVSPQALPPWSRSSAEGEAIRVT